MMILLPVLLLAQIRQGRGSQHFSLMQLLVINRTGYCSFSDNPHDVYAEIDSNAKTLPDIYKDDVQSAFVSALASIT